MELFKIEDVTYTYPEKNEPALREATLAADKGEFLLLTGPSGGGKSTLARILGGFIPAYYGGTISGKALFRGRPLKDMDSKELRRRIGMVFQNPERQIVMKGVEKELAFGQENLGFGPGEMKRNISEVSELMGLTGLLSRDTDRLSGGEKQRLVIASVLAMAREVLILDEPTSQLDPAATEDILNRIRRLRDEAGLTVILIEQHLDECFACADRVIYVNNGAIERVLSPAEYAGWARENGLPFVPLVPRLFAGSGAGEIPLTVDEGRERLETDGRILSGCARPKGGRKEAKESVVRADGITYIYPDMTRALEGVSLDFYRGDVTCVLGANGAGKSTLLRILAGVLRPQSGSVRIMGRDIGALGPAERASLAGYLSQDPNDYLFNETVREELAYTMRNLGGVKISAIERMLKRLGLLDLGGMNPRFTSTGERQRIALGSVLVGNPEVLFIDEPTRGLDNGLKEAVGRLFRDLAQMEDKSVIIVTQDVEFAAEYADDIAILTGGKLSASGSKHEVFSGDHSFLPPATRLFRGKAEGVVTFEDALCILKGEEDG